MLGKKCNGEQAVDLVLNLKGAKSPVLLEEKMRTQLIERLNLQEVSWCFIPNLWYWSKISLNHLGSFRFILKFNFLLNSIWAKLHLIALRLSKKVRFNCRSPLLSSSTAEELLPIYVYTFSLHFRIFFYSLFKFWFSLLRWSSLFILFNWDFSLSAFTIS